MTTMDRDSIAHLGILGMFDAVFRPDASVQAPATKQPEPMCADCGDEPIPHQRRCYECQLYHSAVASAVRKNSQEGS